jgi:hypothetical protein
MSEFTTPMFRERYEQNARANLTRSLERLKRPTGEIDGESTDEASAPRGTFARFYVQNTNYWII